MTAQTSRNRGRPRDAGLDVAVIDACLQLVAEMGPNAVTVDAIASTAGVSKASIYRRWDSKEEIIVEGIARQIAGFEIPTDLPIRDALVAALSGIESFLTESSLGRIFPWLVAEVAAGSELGRRYAQAVILPRKAMLGRVIEIAVERGELRSDLDVELCTDLLMGPAMVMRLLAAMRSVDDGWATRVVDALLDGWKV